MNFFGMGPMEIAVILVIALIIFGPGKLPEIGAAIGRSIRDFRAATRELTSEFEETIREVETTATEVKGTAREVGETTRTALVEAQSVTRSALAEPKADQAPAPATAPANPEVPTVTVDYTPEDPVRPEASNGQRPVVKAPTKDDPLADLAAFGTLLDETAPPQKPSTGSD